MSFHKNLQVLQPLLNDVSKEEAQSFLLEKNDLEFYNVGITRMLSVLGVHKEIGSIMTFTKGQFDEGLFLSKIRKIIQIEKGLNSLIPIKKIETGWELTLVDDKKVRLPSHGIVHLFNEGDDGIPALSKSMKETLKSVSQFLKGKFYLGYEPDSIARMVNRWDVIIIYMAEAPEHLIKKLKGITWEELSFSDKVKPRTGSLELYESDDRVLISWRASLNMFIAIALTCVVGTIVISIGEVIGLMRDQIPWRIKFGILVFAAILALFGSLFLKRQLVIQNGYVKRTRGLIRLPFWSVKKVKLNDILRVDVKVRSESSGDSEGPSTFHEYYDIHITTKQPSQFRLIKDLDKREANFIANKIMEAKNKLNESNQK